MYLIRLIPVYLRYSNHNVFYLKCHPHIQSVYHVLLSFCSTSQVLNTIWTPLSSCGLHLCVPSLPFMTWWQQRRQKAAVQHCSLWIILSLKHANGWVTTPLHVLLNTFCTHIPMHAWWHVSVLVCINHGLCLCYQTVCVLKHKCWRLL